MYRGWKLRFTICRFACVWSCSVAGLTVRLTFGDWWIRVSLSTVFRAKLLNAKARRKLKGRRYTGGSPDSFSDGARICERSGTALQAGGDEAWTRGSVPEVNGGGTEVERLQTAVFRSWCVCAKLAQEHARHRDSLRQL